MRRTPSQLARLLLPPALLAAALLCAGAARLAELDDGRDNYAGKTVVLNELCAKNLTIQADGLTGYDWVELYNPTDAPVDLTGCTLSDRTADPTRWQFPDGTVLGGGEYLVLTADGSGEGLHLNTKLNGGGETLRLYAADGSLLDELSYPELAYDTTYGRRRQDGSHAGLLAVATPGEANPADFWQKEVGTAALGGVSFSRQGGFYGEDFALTLTADDPDAVILYTTDGSEPDMDSAFYTAPLSITDRSALPNRYLSQPSTLDAGYWLKNYAVRYAPTPVTKATTVTARLYKDGVLGESVTAQTYWVGAPSYTLPVVSITGNAGDLFGREGIYLPGLTYFTLRKYGISGTLGNYSAGRSIDVRVQLFAADGSTLLRDSGTLKVTGGVSRTTETLKNLRLRLDSTATELIPGVGALTDLTLRGSGASAVHFSLHKDAFLNNYLVGSAVGERLGVRENHPALLFLEDEYWGLYTLREPLNANYLARHFGVDAKTVQMPETDEAEDAPVMQALAEEIDALPDDGDTAYAWAEAHFDLENYADWLIAQLFTGNLDGLYSGGNNTVLWRTTVPDAANPCADGRWRFVLNDLDATLFEADADPLTPLLEGDYRPDGPLADVLNWYCVPCRLFQKLWQSDAFRTFLTDRLQNALATTYAPENLLPAFDAWCELLRPELEEDLARQEIVPNALAPLADRLTGSNAPEALPTVEEWEQNAAGVRLYLQRRQETLRSAFAGNARP